MSARELHLVRRAHSALIVTMLFVIVALLAIIEIQLSRLIGVRILTVFPKYPFLSYPRIWNQP